MKRILLCLLLYAGLAQAADVPVNFNNPEQAKRYYDMLEEVRCLVCQNQSLADSNADLAQDLRNEIYSMITADKSDSEIITFLVERYGDFVLYRPPLQENTWLLWLGPFLFLLIAIIVAILLIRKQSATVNNDIALSQEQLQQLDKLADKSDGEQ